MRKHGGVVVGLALLSACSTTSSVRDGGSREDGGPHDDFLDGGTGESSALDAGDGAPLADAGRGFPRLGVYSMNVDGTGLKLLVDAGAREFSHVRRLPATRWLTATRYGQDPDHNGLSMENESGFGAFYSGTQVVVFPLDDPSAQVVLAGTPSGGLAANPSWTDDGKLLHLVIDGDAGPLGAHFNRLTFGAIPAVSSTETLVVPAELTIPVDPHQHGPSDASGFIVFTALFKLSSKWMAPVWKMPATGTASLSAVSLVGCPICPSQGGCCGWTNLGDVLGTNDARVSHSGSDVLWMQQHPDVSFSFPGPSGPISVYPQRQAMRSLNASAQVDLPAAGVANTTLLSYGEWRADDQELVYWSVDLQAVTKQHLNLMNRDGTNRRRIPLPGELCPLHPSYLSATEIVFNAWRCSVPDCTCDVARL